MSSDLPPEPPALIAQASSEHRFGGFVFSGSEDAIERLRRDGEGMGIAFQEIQMRRSERSVMVVPASGPGELERVLELANKASQGSFGDIRQSLIATPPRR